MNQFDIINSVHKNFHQSSEDRIGLNGITSYYRASAVTSF